MERDVNEIDKEKSKGIWRTKKKKKKPGQIIQAETGKDSHHPHP